MAQIIANRYIREDGTLIDARTGQPVVQGGEQKPQETLEEMGKRVANQGKPGYDVFGNPVAKTETESPSPSTVRRYTDAAAEIFAAGGAAGNRKPYTPEEEAKIRQQERDRVQAQIDAINEAAEIELAAARERGTQRLGRNRARLSSLGMIGSGSETTAVKGVEDVNATEERAILASKADKIAKIYGDVDTRATDLIEKQKTLATTNAAAYLEYLKEASTQARNDFTALATAQAELSPAQKRRLLEQTGYDETTFDSLYKSIQIANAPQDEYINKDKPEIIGDKAIYFKKVRDPKTGKVTLVTETLTLPASAGKKVKQTVNTANGVQVLYEDGTYERIGGLPPTAAERDAANAGNNASTISSQLQTAKNALAKAKELSHAAGRGRTWLEARKQDIFGDTEYTNLEAYANTLRTNILSLATDPQVKKFFGPQMSNADVQLMTSAGTSLNPELMGPEAFGDELTRLEEVLNRLAAAKGVDLNEGEGAASGMVRMTGPDGTFDVPADQVETFKQNGYSEQL